MLSSQYTQFTRLTTFILNHLSYSFIVTFNIVIPDDVFSSNTKARINCKFQIEIK